MKKHFFSAISVKLCLAVLVTIILGAIFFPMISPFDYDVQNVAFVNRPAFSEDPVSGKLHLLGTDALGRDQFARLWYGARISLFIAVAVALIDCVIGAIYGGISGYFGGTVDQIMMRAVEIISGIPYLVVVLLLMAVLPRGLGTILLAYSITGWTGLARLVRGQVLSLCRREFILTQRVMGSSPWKIITKHLLPNTANIIIVSVTMDIPNVIFTEAFLSLLGLGIAPPLPSLGILANQGIQMFQSYPFQLLYPTLLIVFISMAFNLLGERLREVFDFRARRKL